MPSQYIRYPTETGGGGGTIADINGATGPSINILPGTGIGVSTVGNNITITNTGGSGTVTDVTGTSPINSSGGTTPDISIDSSAIVPDQTGHNGEFLTTNGTVSSWAPIDVTGSPNTFAGFDGSGDLESIPGFNIDTTSGGMHADLTEHPNALNGIFQVNELSESLDPLQDSPNEGWNTLAINADIDPNSTGFDIGSTGTAVQNISSNIRHHGTSPVGDLVHLTTNFDLGNGTDPITVGGMEIVLGFGTVNSGVTLDGPIQGYGFQPNIQAGASVTSNFSSQAFYDFANYQIPINGHTSFAAGPNILEINNNSNFNGMSVNPNIATLTGNAGYFGIGSYPNITTTGATSNVTQFNSNVTIGTMGTNSSLNGVSLGGNVTTMGSNSNVTGLSFSPTITTSHGGVSGVLVNPTISGGDADFVGLQVTPNGSATIGTVTGVRIQLSNLTDGDNPQGATGIESDSRLSINASTQLLSGQVFQIGSRLEHLFSVPIGSPVTGTDELAVNIAGDFLVQDNVANGGLGIGFNSVGFIASMGVAATKTVDTITVFLPAAATPDPGFTTGGNVTDFHLIRTFAPLPQGGTLNITNLYGLKIDDLGAPFSSFATNAWGIYVTDTALQNHFGGPVDVGSLSSVGTITGSNLSGTNTGNVTLSAVGASPNANAASLSGQVLNLQPFDSTHPGVVTASGGGTTNFLRADGSWAVPSSAGANTALSNLASTAVNADINPGVTDTINLGSAAKTYLSVFAETYSSDALLTVKSRNNTTSDNVRIETGNASSGNSGDINISTGGASATRGDVFLQGTVIHLDPDIEISATGKNIVDLADPVNAQDAATKAYVQSIVSPTFVIFKEVQSSGVAGGSANSGSWNTRVLNTTENSQSWASLSTNVVTLNAGTYLVEGSAPAWKTNQHQSRFQNTSDATTAITGSSEISAAADNVQSRSMISGVFTIASSKNFELQHQPDTSSATSGFGISGGFGSEVYSQIKITKIG